MEFKIEKDKKLFYLQNKAWMQVDLKPCFPSSHPEKYFSIRDEKGNEVALLERLQDLDEANRKIVQDYLAFKNFVFEIEGVYSIDEDFGLRHFEVKTSKGDRCFQTPLDEWPHQSEDGTILMECLHGEQYRIQQLQFGDKILKGYL